MVRPSQSVLLYGVCPHIVQYARPIYDAKSEMVTRMNLTKCAMVFKFLLRLGFFNTTKRKAAAEAVYKPGGKGHKRCRDEFEGMASPQLHAVRAWVISMFAGIG